MGYKLVVLDIDGTIRNAEHGPSKRIREVLSRVQESGAIVTLATGRMFDSAIEATKGLNISSPIITFQGAHIADPVTKKVLWHRPLTSTMALSALDALKEWPTEILAYLGNRVYTNLNTPWIEGYNRRQGGRVKVVSDLRPIAKKRLTRLVVVGDSEQVRILSNKLKSSLEPELNIIPSLPQFCEILHPATGKHRALKWLCNYLSVPQNQTVAFGNGHEDTNMLRWAGLGIAVQNGALELLQKADQIAPPLEEDGVAQVLEKLLSEGLIG